MSQEFWKLVSLIFIIFIIIIISIGFRVYSYGKVVSDLSSTELVK